MKIEDSHEKFIDVKLLSIIKQFERKKEQQLVQLIIEILITSTLTEYHEKSNQIFKIQ